jgi:hypothetical protein
MQLNEGGHVFKDKDGNPLTQRIRREDVVPTVQWLEKLTGLDLTNNMLGTTGKKETSGDLDLAVDANKIDKNSLIELMLNKGIDKKDVRKSGDSVHLKTPIKGDPALGYVQTDFMFGEPEWQKFSMQGGRDGSLYPGMARHIILASVVSAIDPKLKWSYKNGIVDRETNETIPDGKKPETLSKLTGIPVEHLNNADSILDVLRTRPDYDKLVGAARQTLAQQNIQLPESRGPFGSSTWFRDLMNRL